MRHDAKRTSIRDADNGGRPRGGGLSRISADDCSSEALDVRARFTAEALRHEPNRTLADLAKTLNLSTSRLRHLFKEQMALTPSQYVKLSRLARARDLLEGSSLTVKQVMAAVGFSDPSHFARDYRSVHGQCPSQARTARNVIRGNSSAEMSSRQRQRLAIFANEIQFLDEAGRCNLAPHVTTGSFRAPHLVARPRTADRGCRGGGHEPDRHAGDNSTDCNRKDRTHIPAIRRTLTNRAMPGEETMSDETLVRRFFDAYNGGNADEMAGLFADDGVVEYAGGVPDKAVHKGKDQLANLFRKMVRQGQGPSKALSCPKTVLSREGMTAVEWSTVLSTESGASLVARGVNVCEIENGRFHKMTVYLPQTTHPLTGRLSVKDLGELSLIAWAIV